MIKRTILAIAAAAALAVPAQASENLSWPTWYVVAGSYKSHLKDEAILNSARVMGAAERCGFKVQHVNSNEILNAMPNRIMQVIGPYWSYDRAHIVLARVKPCIPDAFVKQLIEDPE